MRFAPLLAPYRIGFLVAGIFLAVSLLLLPHYGVSWDEPLHGQWANQIIDHMLAGKPGLPELAGNGIYYGPAYFLLNRAVMEIAVRLFDVPVIPAMHLMNVITGAAGVFLTFGIARTLIGERVALAASILMALYVPFLAHAHYNPKDIPTMVMATACLWSYVAYVRKPTLKRAAIAGALTGVAFAMKITGLIVIPVFLVAYGAHLFVARRGRMLATLKIHARHDPIALVAMAAALFLSWPTLWKDPTLLWQSIRMFLTGEFWTGTVRYFGVVYPGEALPWHYVPFWLFASTEILVFSAVVLGIAVAARMMRVPRHALGAALLLAWLFVPVLLAMKPGLARYDGMRQIFLVVPAMMILAAWGLERAEAYLATRIALPAFAAKVAFALLCAWLIAESAHVHPYQGSYVNEAVRGAMGPHLEKQFELEYWGSTYQEGTAWLRENTQANPTICVPFVGQLMLFYLDRFRSDFAFNCEDGRTHVMYFTRNQSINDQYEGTGNVVFRIQRYGSDLLRIHEYPR